MKKGGNHSYLIGMRFGRLVVIGNYEPGFQKKGSKRIYPSVLCQCDCGSEKRVAVDNLRTGATKSCGCFRSENSSKMWKVLGKIGGRKRRKYSTSESSARDLFQKYMKRHPGNLSLEKFCELTQQHCYHCGSAPSQKYLVKNVTDDLGTYIYNGLDRLDNSKGYDLDNVVPCCGRCNFMRLNLTLDEFYKHVKKILSYQEVK